VTREGGPGKEQGVVRLQDEAGEGYSAAAFLTMMSMVYVTMIGLLISYFTKKVESHQFVGPYLASSSGGTFNYQSSTSLQACALSCISILIQRYA